MVLVYTYAPRELHQAQTISPSNEVVVSVCTTLHSAQHSTRTYNHPTDSALRIENSDATHLNSLKRERVEANKTSACAQGSLFRVAAQIRNYIFKSLSKYSNGAAAFGNSVRSLATDLRATRFTCQSATRRPPTFRLTQARVALCLAFALRHAASMYHIYSYMELHNVQIVAFAASLIGLCEYRMRCECDGKNQDFTNRMRPWSKSRCKTHLKRDYTQTHSCSQFGNRAVDAVYVCRMCFGLMMMCIATK